MSRVRVHNFSISLDGFATGEPSVPRRAVRPRGPSAARVDVRHPVRCAEVLGEPGGTAGVDDAFAQHHGRGIGAEIMGAGKFGPPGWQDDPEWQGLVGRRTRRSTRRPSCSPTVRDPSIEMEGGTTFHFLDAAPGRGARGRPRRRRRPGRPHRRRPDRRARLPRRRPRRPPAPRPGADRARPRCPAVGRPRGARSTPYDIEAVPTPSGVTHLTFTR